VPATAVALLVNATEVVAVAAPAAPAEDVITVVAVAIPSTNVERCPALADIATVVDENRYKERTPLGRTVAVLVAESKLAATKPILRAAAVAVLPVTAIADAEESVGNPAFRVAIFKLVGKPAADVVAVLATPTGASAVEVLGTEIATNTPLINAPINGNVIFC
jgi:phage tail protein X